MTKEKRKVAETILTQLRVQNPLFRAKYNVRQMMTLDEKGGGIRLNTHQNSDTVNIDIIYDSGKDLYEVKAYKFNLPKMILEPKKVYDSKDIFFDQLDETITEALKSAKEKKLKEVV